MLHRETIAFAWETPEFEFIEKKRDWYWIIGIGAFILIVVSIVMDNYLFAFLVLLGAFLMIQMAHHEPLDLQIEISQAGIRYHNEVFNYENIYHFWIEKKSNESPAYLLLSLNRNLLPRIVIRIDDAIDPLELREYLLDFIPEEKVLEPLTHKVMRKIKF